MQNLSYHFLRFFFLIKFGYITSIELIFFRKETKNNIVLIIVSSNNLKLTFYHDTIRKDSWKINNSFIE